MGLTDKEKFILKDLVSAWNTWQSLEKYSTVDDIEFQTAIHQAQHLIALRVARRVDPEIWRI